jgi:hypothetical protein
VITTSTPTALSVAVGYTRRGWRVVPFVKEIIDLLVAIVRREVSS